MGVVYTTSEFREGNMPREGAHLDAAQQLLSNVPLIPGVQMVMVHGSVAELRFNARSDLDLLVTYQPECTTASEIARVISSAGEKTNVKIEPNLWPSDESVELLKFRAYDPLFNTHLRDSMLQDGWRSGEIDPRIIELGDRTISENMGMKPVLDIIMAYVIYKNQGFSSAPPRFKTGEREQKTCPIMQRALELPKSVRRKTRQASDLGANDLEDILSGNEYN